VWQRLFVNEFTAMNDEDHPAQCHQCDAVCCRLTVVLTDQDTVPTALTATTTQGLKVMARTDQGWCVAMDTSRMACSIYATRPSVCRRFVMDGPYCRHVRNDYTYRLDNRIPLKVLQGD